MPSVAFVINRTRVRDPGRFGRRCRAAARAAGWEPLFAETSAADGGYGAARQALAAGASLIFAAGGDGTVRACAQALAGTGAAGHHPARHREPDRPGAGHPLPARPGAATRGCTAGTGSSTWPWPNSTAPGRA